MLSEFYRCPPSASFYIILLSAPKAFRSIPPRLGGAFLAKCKTQTKLTISLFPVQKGKALKGFCTLLSARSLRESEGSSCHIFCPISRQYYPRGLVLLLIFLRRLRNTSRLHNSPPLRRTVPGSRVSFYNSISWYLFQTY